MTNDINMCHSYHFFFFNDTATTEIYTLSLHDALPILPSVCLSGSPTSSGTRPPRGSAPFTTPGDRKSTRLNSSHSQISYAVFCLKKKKKKKYNRHTTPTIPSANLLYTYHSTPSYPISP